MKVTTVQFYDYRVFYNGEKGEYFISVDGKNLLIYGENGSGKTSFFKGFKDFVQLADFTSHTQAKQLNGGFVEFKFNDGSTERFNAGGDKTHRAEIINTSKLNSFLSYKELLRTHFYETDEINLFDLLVNGILVEHSLETLGKLRQAWITLISKNLKDQILQINEAFAKSEIDEEQSKEQIEIVEQELEKDVLKFSDELTQLLGQINGQLKKILDYFNQNIEVSLGLEPIISNQFSEAKILAKVKYFGRSIPSHHEFLNEARLSALAISIYLSAIKSNPTQNTLKILFLDDIFLGLDMGNRLPLLEVLQVEFSDWQIFLTTYDKHWFMVAKQQLGGSTWNYLEMYAAKKDGQDFEHPVIIANSDNYLEKATNYFDLKDYPACSNYLRKEIERLVKDRLPEENVRIYGGKPHSLSHLWEILIDRYTGLGHQINESVKNAFATCRLILLNPQSHDNLSIPIYKLELEKVFKLVQEISDLPHIKSIVLFSRGMELEFKHPGYGYIFRFMLTSDWRLEINGDVKKHNYPKCQVKYFEFNKCKFWSFKMSRELNNEEQQAVLEREDNLEKIIANHCKIRELGITKEMFEANTSYEKKWTMKEIVDKAEAQERGSWFTRLFRK